MKNKTLLLISLSLLPSISRADKQLDKVVAHAVRAHLALPSVKVKGSIDRVLGGQSTQAEFTMVLRRPSQYLIEWTETGRGKRALWKSEQAARIYSELPKSKVEAFPEGSTLNLAFNTLKEPGIHSLPSLFYPFNLPSGFMSDPDLSYVGVESCGKESCHVVEKRTYENALTTEKWWFSEKTHYLKKHETATALPVTKITESFGEYDSPTELSTEFVPPADALRENIQLPENEFLPVAKTKLEEYLTTGEEARQNKIACQSRGKRNAKVNCAEIDQIITFSVQILSRWAPVVLETGEITKVVDALKLVDKLAPEGSKNAIAARRLLGFFTS